MLKSIGNKIKTLSKELSDLFVSDTSRGQLLKGGLGSVLINFTNKLLVLISGVLLVRFLGKEEFGIYSYVLSLIFVLIIPAEFGLSNLIVRETAQGVSQDKPGLIAGVWRWSLRITLLICAILIVFSGFALIWVVPLFSRMEIMTFLWALSLMPFQAIIHLASAALRGQKHVIRGQLPDLVVLPGLFAVLYIIVYFLTPDYLTASSSMALRSLATVVAFAVSIIFFIRKTPRFIRTAKKIFQSRQWLTSALQLALSSGLNMVKTRISILLMGFFVSAGQIGTFQVAVSSAALAGLALQANNATLAPQFASLYVQGKKKALQRLVTISTRLVLAFNIAVTVIFIIFGKQLLSFVFGPDLIEAYPAILIMLIGQLINALVGSVAYLLNMTGHENDVMKVIGLSSLLNIVVTLIAAPSWGIVGGAVSSAVSLTVAQIIMAVLVYKRLGIISHPFLRTQSKNNSSSNSNDNE